MSKTPQNTLQKTLQHAAPRVSAFSPKNLRLTELLDVPSIMLAILSLSTFMSSESALDLKISRCKNRILLIENETVLSEGI